MTIAVHAHLPEQPGRRAHPLRQNGDIYRLVAAEANKITRDQCLTDGRKAGNADLEIHIDAAK